MIVRRGFTALVVVGLVVAGCSSGEGEDGSATTVAAPTTRGNVGRDAGDVVELRPLAVSDDRRIVDDLGREVLLRGVNLTSLGEYWQGDPDHLPTMPTTDDDWDELAARGQSVVRLVISWSRVEPTRGEIDEAYLDEIDRYVTAAADRGIYTVIDMHQDAYSAFISAEPGQRCPEGTEPAKGWDGAPAWAVITDGASTCTSGERNATPAVVNAWNHFYDDTDGIRTEFTKAWAAVAARFADRPEVAGYDLLNEPEVSRPGVELIPLYDDLVADTVVAIRDAEADAHFAHLIFVEPAIPAGNPSFGLVIPDPDRIGMAPEGIVAGPHNYAESIQPDVTISAMNDLFVRVADDLGVPVWIGEYGFWDTSPETLDKVRRFGEDQDRLRLGGAWWQWRQPCGDPHSIRFGGWAVTEPETSTHLHQLGCPGDRDLGPTDAFLDVLGRGYPRAAPGRLTELRSDAETGELLVKAEHASPPGTLVVWTPTTDATHTIAVTGVLGDPVSIPVPGGRLVTAEVLQGDGVYELRVQPK